MIGCEHCTGPVRNDCQQCGAPVCCPACCADEVARQRADAHYNQMKNSGELRARDDHRALMYQINEGPKWTR